MIDKSEYEKRLARITDIFAGIVEHASDQAQTRCPYKNARDQCTAKFGCRYQRKSSLPEDPLDCTHDGTLDYRTAWESDPQQYEQLRKTLQSTARTGRQTDSAAGRMRCGDADCALSVGQTLFDHADVLGVPVPTSCGRMGHCHECVVQVRAGQDALTVPTEAEEFLRGDYRLACQASVVSSQADVEFGLLRRSPKILTSQSRRAVSLDPPVSRQGDAVHYDGERIDQYRGRICGLAVDVGTTTVVAELVDLETGASLSVSAFENPQRFGGSDVLNRISYDGGPFRGELHRAMVNTLNTEIRRLCLQSQVSRHQLYEILIVGNATMRDLCFGLDVQSIGQKPYKSLTEQEQLAGSRDSTMLIQPARKLRMLANKNARVFGVPLIASHVGGDVVADLVAVDADQISDLFMLVDIGTNTEVIIGNRQRLVAASCPAGPAFEGGLVKFGMPGCEGAIESVRWRDGTFECATIGEGPPQGICGSGLIDLLAELRRHDLMTPLGVFADKAREFTIVPQQGITFSRQDASHLAQAKAANYCGQWILMRHFGVTPDQISKLYLAGGFANYIEPAAAVEIGFLAPVPLDRIEKVGNAASQGARELLLSQSKRQAVERLMKTVEHVELETTPDFFEIFVDACRFEPMQVGQNR